MNYRDNLHRAFFGPVDDEVVADRPEKNPAHAGSKYLAMQPSAKSATPYGKSSGPAKKSPSPSEVQDVRTLPTPSRGRIFAATYPSSGVLVEFEYKESLKFSEELVKQVISCMLEGQGYSAKHRTKSEKGPDIEAFSPSEKPVIVEAKGEGNRPQEFRNYFQAALGQILFRMTSDKSTYAIALPWHEKFVALVRQLPRRTRQTLGLEFWLIKPISGIYDYHVGILPSDAE